MKRIDYIRKMPIEEIAKAIIKYVATSAYCDSSCGNEDSCFHETECCIRWLESEESGQKGCGTRSELEGQEWE